MADVFISYSRKDGEFAKRLTNALKKQERDVWIDWEDIPRAEDWLNEIYAGIESADTFLLVVSQHSLASEICNYEIAHARKHNKRVVPLILQKIEGDVDKLVKGTWYGKPWQQTADENWKQVGHLNWLIFETNENFDTELAALTETLDTDIAHVKPHTRLLVRAREWEEGGHNPSLLLFGDEITSAETWLKQAEGKTPLATQLHRDFIRESRRIEDERQRRAEVQERRIRQFRLTAAGLAVMVVLAVAAIIAAVIQTGQVRAERELFGLQVERVSTLSAGGVIVSLDDIAPTPEMFVVTTTAIAKLVAWEPTTRDFEGVEMVQVPIGCFWMGSNFNLDEQPVHEVCFDKRFWIDRYEVTNEQFDHFSGVAANSANWPNPNQPHTGVTWFEARDYCTLRGARLPTEAEWEYAARGPDSRIYPWGNDFIEDNVVYYNNSRFEAAEVGSRLSGVSWVGAYDMSGNVWEWVSTAYRDFLGITEFTYPYDPDDGREDLNRTDVERVGRGGSYGNENNYVRAAIRLWDDPDEVVNNIGFRCARASS